MEHKKKIYAPGEALKKAADWCARQERCQQEVRDKLYSWGQHEASVENIIAELISGGYISEERYAAAFARGKFRIKKWGRIKIKIELKKKKVSDVCIRKALQEIDDAEYMRVLKKEVNDKWKSEKEKHPLKKKYKVMRYLISRGFEPDLVSDAVSSLIKEE
ncbi:MAG: hypothetical protein Fur0041_01150 [Bacteroidia bacterium]